MLDEIDKWVKSLEAQLPATRRLREELEQDRLLEEQYQRESCSIPINNPA